MCRARRFVPGSRLALGKDSPRLSRATLLAVVKNAIATSETSSRACACISSVLPRPASAKINTRRCFLSSFQSMSSAKRRGDLSRSIALPSFPRQVTKRLSRARGVTAELVWGPIVADANLAERSSESTSIFAYNLAAVSEELTSKLFRFSGATLPGWVQLGISTCLMIPFFRIRHRWWPFCGSPRKRRKSQSVVAIRIRS